MLLEKTKRRNKLGAGPPRLPKTKRRVKLTLTFSRKVMTLIDFMKKKYRKPAGGRLMYTTIVEAAVLILCTLGEDELKNLFEEHVKNRLMRDKKEKKEKIKPEKETRGRPRKIIENNLNN